MNNFIFSAAFVACLAVANCGLIAQAPIAVDSWAPAHYQFEYAVSDAHTGDQKSQSEVREGDVVKGQYSLLEPDGTTRIVQYSADPHNGFNAVVKRIGHAVHPQVVHKAVVAAPVLSHSISAPVVAAHSPVLNAGWGGLGLLH